ncbi:diguanylate cyclase [Mycobacterium sp. PDNC021]|uniref:GGDEF domain-containing protein n=1 Tax=Mycobacterium sp. PDNC021 TaxID=3391399 RepID=UPI003AAD1322
MSQEWVLAVSLGTLAMAGVGLLFFVVWLVDRRRTSALFFALAIGCYSAATTALSVPLPAAFASSVHGVLFPVAMALLADGLLRRVGDRLPRGYLVWYVTVSVIVVWCLAYPWPLIVGRIITQNLGTALLLFAVVRRLWRRVPKTGTDRAALTASAALAVALGADVVAALFSNVPRELTNRAELDSYMSSNLEVFLIVASTIVLPACMITLLAVTVIDVVQELRFQRDRDELTGVLNRRGFNHRAEAMLQSAESCAFILADLDHFKAVNDTLGHSGGDKVLKAFARILNQCPGEARIIGRVGGEEFAVLLPDADTQTAVEWADAARARMVAQAPELGDGMATVTASFGIAAGGPRSRLDALVNEADEALYRAKLGGRNQIVVRS